MNLHEYETLRRPVYEAFAKVVQFILERAISADSRIPRPQAVQSRAKQAESLRRNAGNEIMGKRLSTYRRKCSGIWLRSGSICCACSPG